MITIAKKKRSNTRRTLTGLFFFITGITAVAPMLCWDLFLLQTPNNNSEGEGGGGAAEDMRRGGGVESVCKSERKESDIVGERGGVGGGSARDFWGRGVRGFGGGGVRAGRGGCGTEGLEEKEEGERAGGGHGGGRWVRVLGTVIVGLLFLCGRLWLNGGTPPLFVPQVEDTYIHTGTHIYIHTGHRYTRRHT
jgi:hypothetical protein